MKFDLNRREFHWFNEISRIPRGSRNEKAISDYICRMAETYGYPWYQDDVWNTIVDVPASQGYENAAPLIIQAHTDMVCEKTADSDHDFLKDPLELYEEDGILHARGTTLGADDGIGVGMMLAIMEDKELVHPPLELIFSTMEEVGLVGAGHLKPEDIRADRFITLDCMDEAKADLCAAGGCYGRSEIDLEMEPNSDPAYRLRIYGLPGGHSGTEIHKEHGNAIRIAVRFLLEAVNNGAGIRAVSFQGGRMENVICTEAEAVFTSDAPEEALEASFRKTWQDVSTELHDSDPDVAYTLDPVEDIHEHASLETTLGILRYIDLVPDGFQHRSMSIPGLTATSLNHGVIRTEGNHVTMSALLRSMIDSAVLDLCRRMETIASMTGVTFTAYGFYAGWNYSEISPMRDKFAQACRMHGRELAVKADHGGLEAGVFAGLHPGLDIITVGADTRYYHTPQEELDLASFANCYEILKDIIRLCAEE